MRSVLALNGRSMWMNGSALSTSDYTISWLGHTGLSASFSGVGTSMTTPTTSAWSADGIHGGEQVVVNFNYPLYKSSYLYVNGISGSSMSTTLGDTKTLSITGTVTGDVTVSSWTLGDNRFTASSTAIDYKFYHSDAAAVFGLYRFEQSATNLPTAIASAMTRVNMPYLLCYSGSYPNSMGHGATASSYGSTYKLSGIQVKYVSSNVSLKLYKHSTPPGETWPDTRSILFACINGGSYPPMKCNLIGETTITAGKSLSAGTVYTCTQSGQSSLPASASSYFDPVSSLQFCVRNTYNDFAIAYTMSGPPSATAFISGLAP